MTVLLKLVKPQKVWAIVEPGGSVLLGSLWTTRKMTIDKLIDGEDDWQEWLKSGFTVRKVTITEGWE